ncbi:hypothetical protein [Brevibacillus marinus]|nr:hypothetical protein [Brevibacillus marinus]
MSHLVSLLLVVAMVGMLCAAIWALEPVEKVNESQQIRVRTAGTLTFH